MRKPLYLLTEEIQDYLNMAIAQTNRNDCHNFIIDYRECKGFFAIPCEPRFIGDDGDFMGTTYKDAIEYIDWLFGKPLIKNCVFHGQ